MAPILTNTRKIGHGPIAPALAANSEAELGRVPAHSARPARSRETAAIAASPRTPPAISTGSGAAPATLSPRAISAATASHAFLIAERPSFQIACRIRAITTGFTPYRRPETAGSLP